jgi:hypothetical protein
MATLTRRLGAAALVSVAAGLLVVPPVLAQPNRPVNQVPFIPGATRPFGNNRLLGNPNWQIAPGLPLNQAAFNTAVLGRALRNVPPWAAGYNPYPSPNFGPVFGGFNSLNSTPYAGLAGAASLTSTPYGGAYGGGISPYAYSPGAGGYGGYGGGDLGGYGGYSYPDPYGGGLRGAAEAIAAQGKFEIDFQRARLLNQEAERSKVDTRRKIYDEWLYERANTPTLVDLQERSQKLELRRAMLGMPPTEILSGYALNTLLTDLQKKMPLNAKDPYGPIDPEMLKQINVTSQSSAGNIGVLKAVKEGAPLNWPLPLQGTAYQDEVRRLNRLATEALNLVQNRGQVDPATLNNMKEDIKTLRSKVSAHINELTPSQSIEANRYLNQLGDAVTALAQADVANYFPDKFAVKAKTVPDLIKFMTEKGLKFAPAVGGDEAAYSALYNYLVGYAMQAGQGASNQ